MEMDCGGFAEALQGFIFRKAHAGKAVNGGDSCFVAMVKPFNFNSQGCFLQHTDSEPV